jgi:hypothetical protein
MMPATSEAVYFLSNQSIGTRDYSFLGYQPHFRGAAVRPPS